MQRGLVVGPLQPHPRTDQQGKNAHRGEHEVVSQGATGNRFERDRDQALRIVQAENAVTDLFTGAGGM